jgi:hypothetical protein
MTDYHFNEHQTSLLITALAIAIEARAAGARDMTALVLRITGGVDATEQRKYAKKVLERWTRKYGPQREMPF